MNQQKLLPSQKRFAARLSVAAVAAVMITVTSNEDVGAIARSARLWDKDSGVYRQSLRLELPKYCGRVGVVYVFAVL